MKKSPKKNTDPNHIGLLDIIRADYENWLDVEKLTQKYLKEILYYNPFTGIFIWKRYRSRFVKPGDIAGTKVKYGYIHIGIDGKIYKAHHLAWLYIHGYFPENQIRHINHIKDDNRIENLTAIK